MVGQIMLTLESTGNLANTLVIFTSDNGGMFNLGGRMAADKGHKINGSLLGSKFGIWEGGHRVPFIAHWPQKIPAGLESNQLISNVDMLSTFAHLTGQKLPPHERKDSINMLPAILAETIEPIRNEMIVTPRSRKHVGLRVGKWMYIDAQGDGGFKGSKPHHHAWGGAAVTTLVHTPNSDIENGKIKKSAAPAQLYNLEEDVNQTTNLYYQHPEVVAQMRQKLEIYIQGER